MSQMIIAQIIATLLVCGSRSYENYKPSQYKILLEDFFNENKKTLTAPAFNPNVEKWHSFLSKNQYGQGLHTEMPLPKKKKALYPEKRPNIKENTDFFYSVIYDS